MSRRGFSVLEATFTLALVALSFLLIGGILGEYARIDKFARNQDRATKVAGFVFARLRTDCQSSVEIVSPSPRTSGSELRLQKFAPRPDRLLPDPTWEPRNPADIRAIRYFVSGAVLQRNSLGQDERLVEGVEEFLCSRLEPQGLDIQLTLAGDRPRMLSTHVHLPVWNQP